MNPRLIPQQNEIPHKVWMYDTAESIGITMHALEMRIHRGLHPKPKIRAANKRVLFVVVEK